jgi:hypothetical protein
VNSDQGVYQRIRAHLDRFWPGHPHEEFVWTLGPIGMTLPRFTVRRIAPVEPSHPWVYATVGAWEAGSGEPHGTEFFLLSSIEDSRHVELLAMVANLQADDRYRLMVGSTVNIGRPWADGSAADRLLVSLPYPYGPEFEHLDLGDRHIRFLWLVPINKAEADLARTQGLDALEQRLEGSNVDVIAPTRASVA